MRTMTALDLHALTRAAAGVARAARAPDASFQDAWRQIHYAAQLASEVGKAWAEPQADDSHSNFDWREGTLRGRMIAAPRPFRAVLRPRELTLALVGDDGSQIAALPLDGLRFAEAMEWIRAEAARAADGPPRQASVPAPDLPPHPIASGAPFRCEPQAAFASFADVYTGADAVLRAVAAALPNASPISVWPHHFDIATLASIAVGRTLGIGLAVPDAIEASGYWYVSPRSEAPPGGALEWGALVNGRWVEQDGLRMAVLPFDAWSALSEPGARADALAEFLRDACRIAAANLLR
jgi:hypothetical protein